VKRYQDLQDILGDDQDGVVAADLLRRIAAGTAQYPDENGFTYGLLYAQELHHAQESRRLADAWAMSR
jgi:CHAD domain-containing protein